MSSYRMVNYFELCLLCTSSEGTKVHLFNEEGKKRQLSSKVELCLSYQVKENDWLPKVICSQCVEKLESFSNFRESCLNAKAMLESCYTSSKSCPKFIREGKVYVKDENQKQKQKSQGEEEKSGLKVSVATQYESILEHIRGPVQTGSTQIIRISKVEHSKLSQHCTGCTMETQPTSIPRVVEPSTVCNSYSTKTNMVSVNTTSSNTTLQTKNNTDINDIQSTNWEEPVLLQTSKRAMCALCDKQYSSAGVLKSHMKKVHGIKVHGIETHRLKETVGCLNCESKFTNRIKLVEHLQKHHGQHVEVDILEFRTSEEFEAWRGDEEMRTVSMFVKCRGEQRTKNGSSTILLCCRDGRIKILKNRQRALKRQGSRKIGHPCTSHMIVNKVLQPEEKILVKYVKTHYGHETEVEHTKLSQTGKLNSVKKLAVDKSEVSPSRRGILKRRDITNNITQFRRGCLEEKSYANDMNQKPMVEETLSQEHNYARVPSTDEVTYEWSSAPVQNEGSEVVECEIVNETIILDPDQREDNYVHFCLHNKDIKDQSKPATADERELKAQIGQTIKTGEVEKKPMPVAMVYIGNVKQLSSTEPQANHTLSCSYLINKDTGQFLCDVCSKTFKRKAHLFEHKKMHTGERPHPCTMCGKAFHRREHLLRHLVTHTGHRSHTCEVCNKYFSRKDNLDKHRKIHRNKGLRVC